jgi:hypothetical protein
MNSRSRIVVGAALALTVAFPTIGRADDKEKKVAKDWVVNFAQPLPQSSPAAVTHFLLPDDLTIHKGDTVTFVVNGAGHGIAIHPVSKKTTRADIAEDLCQGPAGTAENDRAARTTVCNGTATTMVTINGTAVLVVGTQNLDYNITDGKDDLIIHTGFNVNIPATATTPAIVITNPRVDDAEHTHRLLATSGSVTGATTAPNNNPSGAFLTGSAPGNPPTPGNRIQVRFQKTGRCLVICMNRGHALNDHMFGFVSVVGGDDDDDDK